MISLHGLDYFLIFMLVLSSVALIHSFIRGKKDKFLALRSIFLVVTIIAYILMLYLRFK